MKKERTLKTYLPILQCTKKLGNKDGEISLKVLELIAYYKQHENQDGLLFITSLLNDYADFIDQSLANLHDGIISSKIPYILRYNIEKNKPIFDKLDELYKKEIINKKDTTEAEDITKIIDKLIIQ